MARYALIIGITEYLSPQLSRLPKAATDAEIVAQLLEQYGDFQVKRLPESWTPDKKRKVGEKKVTGAELGQELETLLLKRAIGSEALIYFAGHGFTVSDNLGEQQGFLATSDCQIEMRGDVAVAQKYGISLESLNKLIAKSDLSSLVMLLDCCHSGYFLERNLIQRTLTAFSAQKDYYLITACRSYEQAKSFKGEAHAIFTGAVLKGLAAENAGSNRRVTGDRLFDFISAELKNSVQEPIRMGWGRSITLVTYPYQEQTTTNVSFNRENPYLGLRAFESDQQKYFFGREQAVRALLDRLTNNRFLAVIGPSGCGKSSLVKAGLLTQLQCDCIPGSSQWDIESFTPGKHPLGTLIEILERRQRQDKLFVLFIDQFEEVFTLCDNPAERQSFVRLMAEQATACEQVTRVIATIRGDFLDRCAEYPEAVSLINHAQPTTYVVTPLSRRELEEAIEKPAALHGVKFEGGLVSQIADDVENQPGALPLLQYALSELWRVFCLQDTPSGQAILSWKDYEQIGRVKGALDKRATLLYRSLSKDNQVFVRHLFMELVQVNEGQELTRRRATWDELEAITNSPDQLQQVVGLLADQQQRLIITDENTVEVAHEALLYEWKLLRGWIEKNREHLWLRRCLEADCREWQQRYQQSDEALLVGARLAAIAEWVEKTETKLPPLEAEFLQKSLARRDRERQEKIEAAKREAEAEARAEAEKAKAAEAIALAEIEKSIAAKDKAEAEAERAKEAEARAKAQAEKAQAEKQRAQVTVGAGFLVAILVVFVGLLRVQSANKEAKTAQINEVNGLIILAETSFRTDRQLEALMMSVTALKKLQKIREPNTNVFNKIKVIISQIRESNRLEGHEKDVMDVSFSPNGEIIASASWDKTVKLWNKNGKLISEPGYKNGSGIWGISFSPDSKTVAAADTDGIIKLWNISNKSKSELKPQILKSDDSVIKVSFSRDGQFLASSYWYKNIKVWRINDGKLMRTIQDQQNPVFMYGVNFSKDGQMIASANKDKTIKIWRVVDGKLLNIFKGHDGLVFGVSFSPNGEILASASWDKTIKIWKVADGQLLQTLKGHSDEVNGISFSQDGKMIASASKDKTVKVWRVVDGKLLQTFKGHTNTVNSVSFSPDMQYIVSASDDKTIRVWSLSPISTKVNNTTELLNNICIWLDSYLKYNSKLSSKERSICSNYRKF